MHLTSALNCLEKNTKLLLRVIIALASLNIHLETSTQHWILNSMHLTSALNCLEKNMQALLIVIITLAPLNMHSLGNFNTALESKQHALDISLKMFGEDHAFTADGNLSISTTQFSLGDINATLDSLRHIFKSTF